MSKKINQIYTTLLLCVFSLALTSNLHAKTLGGQAGAFLRAGLGADRVAMGDCGVASYQGSMNWFYNPASLPFQKTRQAALSYRYMSLDRSIMYAGFSTPIHPTGGLSIGVMRAGTDNIEARDSNGEKYDELTYADNLIHGSFALRPHPRIAIGVSIKWMINSVPDIIDEDKNLYAYGLGIDLGIQAQVMEDLRFGLQIRDLDANHSWETSEVWGEDRGTKDDMLPTQIRVGGIWDPIENLSVIADFVAYGPIIGDDDLALQPHFGGEWRTQFEGDTGLALRGGFNGRSPAVGFGLDFDLSVVRAGLDYAFYMEEESTGGSHLITWIFEY